MLIALMDPAHVHYGVAHGWFGTQGRRGWATCPMAQNAVLRILGQPRYPNSPGLPHLVLPLLREMCGAPEHSFWPDDVSLLDGRHLDPGRLLTAGQIADTYLLALARAHSGPLATSAVPDGPASLAIIG